MGVIFRGDYGKNAPEKKTPVATGRVCSFVFPTERRHRESSDSRRAGYAAQCLYYFFKISTVAGNQTVFLLPVPSSALVTTADLECTHLMHAKSAVFTGATVSGDLAAGCKEAGIRLA
jgi:hypothetical protein